MVSVNNVSGAGSQPPEKPELQEKTEEKKTNTIWSSLDSDGDGKFTKDDEVYHDMNERFTTISWMIARFKDRVGLDEVDPLWDTFEQLLGRSIEEVGAKLREIYIKLEELLYDKVLDLPLDSSEVNAVGQNFDRIYGRRDMLE